MAAKMAKGAWAKGPPKLNGEPPKAVAVDAPPAGATEAPAMPKQNGLLARDRFLHTLVKFVGKPVIAKMADGTVYEGVWHVATASSPADEHQLAIRAARITAGEVPEGFVPGSTALVQWRDVLCVNCLSVDLRRDAPAAGAFSTDSDISGGAGRVAGDRALHSVDPSWIGANVEGGLSGKAGDWDQFEVNERLYGVQNTYDENLYTTALNKADLTPEQLTEADRIARQIEGKTSSNPHIAEERGHELRSNLTEEERFSGVTRNGPRAQGSWRNGVPASVMEAKTDAKPSKAASDAAAPLPAPVAAAAAAPAAPSESVAKAPAPEAQSASLETAGGAAAPKDPPAPASDASAKLPAEKPVAASSDAKDASTTEQKPTEKKAEGQEKGGSKLRATAKEWTPSFALGGGPVRQPPMSHYAGSTGQAMLPMRPLAMMNMAMPPNGAVYMPYAGLMAEQHQQMFVPPMQSPGMAPMQPPASQMLTPKQAGGAPPPEPQLPATGEGEGKAEGPPEGAEADGKATPKVAAMGQSPSMSPAVYNPGMRGMSPMMKGPPLMMPQGQVPQQIHMLPQQAAQMRMQGQQASRMQGYGVGTPASGAAMQPSMLQMTYPGAPYPYDPSMQSMGVPVGAQMSMQGMHLPGMAYGQPRERGGGHTGGRGGRKGPRGDRGGGPAAAAAARPRPNGGAAGAAAKPAASAEGGGGGDAAAVEVSGAPPPEAAAAAGAQESNSSG